MIELELITSTKRCGTFLLLLLVAFFPFIWEKSEAKSILTKLKFIWPFYAVRTHIHAHTLTHFVSFHWHKHSLRRREAVWCRKTTKRRPELVCFTVCSFSFIFRCVYLSFYRSIGLRHFVESLLFSNVFAQVSFFLKKRKKMQRSV